MISKLSLQNFKGATASYTFAAGNLIQGENFAGKSAVDQAIRALVNGYIPGVSKTASGLKMFASDYPMVIAAEIGAARPRIAFEKVKSTVKQTDDNTLAEKIDEPTRVLFDPSIFFNLSDSARISKACELVQSQGMTPEDIDAALVQLVGTHPTLLRHLKSWRDTIKVQAKTVTDLLSASDEFWKAQKTVVAAEKARMQSTVEGVADLGAKDEAALPNRPEAEAERDRAHKAILDYTKRIAAEESLRQTAAADAASLATLRPKVAALAVLREQLAACETRSKNAEAAYETARTGLTEARQLLDAALAEESRYTKLRSEIATLEATAATAPELASNVARLSANVAELEKQVQAANAVVVEAQNALKQAKAAAAAPRSSIPAQGPLRTDDFETNANPDVSYLVTAVVRNVVVNGETIPQLLSIEDWREINESAEAEEDRARNEDYEISQRVTEAEEAAAAADEKLQQLQSNLHCERSDLTDAQESATRAKVASERLAELKKPTTPPPTAERIAQLTAEHRAAVDATNVARVELDYARTALTPARAAVTRAEAEEAELKRIEARSTSQPMTDEALDALRAEHTAAQAALNTASEILNKVIAAEQDAKRIAEAAKKREEVEKEIELLNKIIKIVAQKKTELVSGSIEAPLAIANKLAAGILKGPLVFEEGEIGMRVGEKFVSCRVFSGTESAIVMMGLTAGLAAKSNLRVLILDEVARVDVKNAVRLVRNLLGMVRDRDIDQFILIGPTDERLLNGLSSEDTLNVIRL